MSIQVRLQVAGRAPAPGPRDLCAISKGALAPFETARPPAHDPRFTRRGGPGPGPRPGPLGLGARMHAPAGHGGTAVKNASARRPLVH